MSSAVEFWQTHRLPDWQDLGLCRDYPMEWFFGEEEQEGNLRHRPMLNMAEVSRAQAICADCPVMQECLGWALTNHEEFGVWGGTTGRDRRRWWQQHNIAVRTVGDYDPID